MLIHRDIYRRIHTIGLLIGLFGFLIFTVLVGVYAFHYADKNSQLTFIVAFCFCAAMTLLISFRLIRAKTDQSHAELEEPIYSGQV